MQQILNLPEKWFGAGAARYCDVLPPWFEILLPNISHRKESHLQCKPEWGGPLAFYSYSEWSAWEYYAHKATNYAMLLYSNIVIIIPLFWPIIYASFLHQKCFSNLPKDIILYWGVKIWITKSIGTLRINICWFWWPQYIQDASQFLLSLLPVDISAFRAFRWHNTIW